jgi:hypothetical protein
MQGNDSALAKKPRVRIRFAAAVAARLLQLGSDPDDDMR